MRSSGRDRVVTIIEAALLAAVALLAAWSGYASANWSTEVRLPAPRSTGPVPWTPRAAPGPTYLPEYERPQVAQAEELDATADALFAAGAEAAETADRYVRVTVFLATVLFLVGISGHFRVRAARYGLVGVGVIILVLAVTILIISPKPPA
jgi:hypothetical protein